MTEASWNFHSEVNFFRLDRTFMLDFPAAAE